MQGFRIRAGRLFLHYCSELGPTEFLQGREPVEVGFDGRLVGGWQVWQALEGAWERQVVGLRLRGQDATYPIVFWRHIHTYTDTEEGKRGGNGQADVSYATPPQKGDPREQSQKDHLLWRKKSELADRLEFQLYKYLLEAEVLWNNLQINLVSIK